jgi:resolvase-like protein
MLDAQRKSIIDRLCGKAQLIAEYTEIESGKRTDRPKLAEALAVCRLHRATLIIAKLDRLARNVAFVSNLMEAGVEFEAVDFPTANRLTIHILAAVAEHEAKMIITPPNSPVGDLALLNLDSVTVIGCYFPQRRAKTPFFERCIEVATKTPHLPLLIIGDFNTGRNDLDIEGNGIRFDCADLFIDLCDHAGLVDLWRFRHGERREWTWRSAKNGFRIDHAFGNPAFVNCFPKYRCEIDHEPRLLGLTDHSAITVDLE